MKTYKFISMRDLKIIAYLTMLIDHIGAVILLNIILNYNSLNISYGLDEIFKVYELLRTIGRLSFPIFTFSVVEGFIHTRNFKGYAQRLLILALISEIPFNLAISGTYSFWAAQNVIWTFLIGVVALYVGNRYNNKYIGALALILGALLAQFLRTDYGAYGVILLGSFYYLRNFKYVKYPLWALIIYTNTIYGIASLLPIFFYNGKKKMGSGRWLYLFYPVHLLVLYLLSVYIIKIYSI